MDAITFVSFGRENLEEAPSLPLLERFDRRYPGKRERMSWWQERVLQRRLKQWVIRHEPSAHALFRQHPHR